MTRAMQPEEFLSHDEVRALDPAAFADYVRRLMDGLRVAAQDGHDRPETALPDSALVAHVLDIAEAKLPRQEYERLIQARLWDALWQYAEHLPALYAHAVADVRLTPQERLWAAGRLAIVQALAEHKRDLSQLPETTTA